MHSLKHTDEQLSMTVTSVLMVFGFGLYIAATWLYGQKEG